MWIVKLPILLLVAVVWTVLGLLFWVPLLARSTAIYASTMLLANITGGSCTAHGERLELAVRFYSDGFRNILDSLYGDSVSTHSESRGLNLGRLVLEAIWTALFWGGVAVLLGPRTPVYDVVQGAFVWIREHVGKDAAVGGEGDDQDIDNWMIKGDITTGTIYWQPMDPDYAGTDLGNTRPGDKNKASKVVDNEDELSLTLISTQTGKPTSLWHWDKESKTGYWKDLNRRDNDGLLVVHASGSPNRFEGIWYGAETGLPRPFKLVIGQ